MVNQRRSYIYLHTNAQADTHTHMHGTLYKIYFKMSIFERAKEKGCFISDYIW